ncbi:23-dihydroxybenzoate decarboxylase protein [Rutstroemia sp. NJR-2017a BBW]|nr:23-dihydroxybenzoate decarboxylase protein [Rutstroemia sp. NJR-2017a BBW]
MLDMNLNIVELVPEHLISPTMKQPFTPLPLHLIIPLLLLTPPSLSINTPLLIPLSSGRPTFTFPSSSLYIPGKVALEEHVGNSLISGVFTTPYEPLTNEIQWQDALYKADVIPRLSDIDERIRMMDAANISISVLAFGGPGIQGIFNKTYATWAARFVNDETARIYKWGNYSGRFEFWCSNALQEPHLAALELERCVTQLGGIGSFLGGYTNNGSVNTTIYLDDPSLTPYLDAVVKLNVPIYLHPRMTPPSQQLVFRDYPFLAASPFGFATETAAHALRLMVSGLFDRLRHFERALWPAEKEIGEYWEKNFWVTTAGVRDVGALMDTVRWSGEDRVLWSVDYPFEDTVEMAGWWDRLEVSGWMRRKIGGENARRFLGLARGPEG